MRVDFYLTLQRGLLAAALYHPHNHKAVRETVGWTVPAAAVLDGIENPGEMTLTAVSTLFWRRRNGTGDSGVASSATPVCGFRLSLHA